MSSYPRVYVSQEGAWPCVWTAVLLFQTIAAERVPAFYVSNYELINVSRMLREADRNRAKEGQIKLNFQGHTDTWDDTDNAEKRFYEDRCGREGCSYCGIHKICQLRGTVYLIECQGCGQKYVGETKRPLYKRIDEHRRALEIRETNVFLTTVLQSKPFQILYQFLHEKGHPYAYDPPTFREMIAQLWFEHYSRSHGPPDTSGFEHVFIGEDIMAAVKFTWRGNLKRIGSMLIGTSPEFDMALYTLCFLSRRGREPCKVDIDGCPLHVVSYETIQNDKVFIGTAYPKLGRGVGQCEK